VDGVKRSVEFVEMLHHGKRKRVIRAIWEELLQEAELNVYKNISAKDHLQPWNNMVTFIQCRNPGNESICRLDIHISERHLGYAEDRRWRRAQDLLQGFFEFLQISQITAHSNIVWSLQKNRVRFWICLYLSQYTLQVVRLLNHRGFNAHQFLIINIHECRIFTYRLLSLEELEG
jgi:hypothetical protein